MGVSAGEVNACGVSSNGRLACWGEDVCGNLDAPDGAFTRVATGQASCAIDEDQGLHCWGAGVGTSCRYGEELGAPPSGRFVDVATMNCYACAIDVDGALSCWGCLDAFPDPPTGTFTQVSVGGDVACAVRDDDTLSCWGASGTWEMEHLPEGSDFVQVACPSASDPESLTSCSAIRSDGHLVLGNANPSGEGVPAYIEETAYRQVTVGESVCAVAVDGSKIDCFGTYQFGSHLDWLPPEGDTWAQVSGMRDDYCTLTTSGVISCDGPYMDDVPVAP